MYDIIIVGGGPAGLTAALYALRANKSVFVIEKNGFGGQITYSPKVENYPGTMQMSGNEFADRLLDQILALGAEVELETVLSVTDEGDCKRVKTVEGGDYTARCVILSTGVKHRMLGLEGENSLVGHGISFCAVCDGAFYQNQTVAVAGGGNSALQEAILLSESCREVIVIQNLERFTGEQRLVDVLTAKPNVRTILETVVAGLESRDGELCALKLRDDKTGATSDLKVDGLFIAVGLIPENEGFAHLAKLNNWGYFDSGEDCLTKTPGIFVAGDCRSKTVRQVTTAAADGAVAALAACAYIDRSLNM